MPASGGSQFGSGLGNGVIRGLVAAVCLLVSATAAQAIPKYTTLDGDPRVGNPDGIYVDIRLTFGSGGTDRTTLLWDVSTQPLEGATYYNGESASHPNASVHEFAFNLGIPDSLVVQFVGLDPAWEGLASKNCGSQVKLIGGGGCFEHGVDLGGNGEQSFSFGLRLWDGDDYVDWQVGENGGPDWLGSAEYTGAVGESYNDQTVAYQGGGAIGDPAAHIAAHVGSLNASSGESDSGIAYGDWTGGTTHIPAPAAILLFAPSVLLLGRLRRAVSSPA